MIKKDSKDVDQGKNDQGSEVQERLTKILQEKKNVQAVVRKMENGRYLNILAFSTNKKRIKDLTNYRSQDEQAPGRESSLMNKSHKAKSLKLYESSD